MSPRFHDASTNKSITMAETGTASSKASTHRRDSEKSDPTSDDISRAVTRDDGDRDLEKADTRGTSRSRAFSHPMTRVKTGGDVVVDFDGPEDPYHPLNWPFRQKVVTTLIYGLTTMGSTWATSV
jgi:hypothetical protein